MTKRFSKFAGLGMAAMLGFAGPAAAQTFNTTGNMPDNGSYGDALYFASNSGGLYVKVTGWQINQRNDAVSSAYVGAYSPGLGVTGIGDDNGANGYHQIDNAGGYNDFVLLQFSAPVKLSELNLNSFTLGSSTTKDNDLAVYAANVPETNWYDSLALNSLTFPANLWTTYNGTGHDGAVNINATQASREWLVGSAFNSGNNDGFKIAGITVTPAVPEPATWAMMLVGFAATGLMMSAARRKQHDAAMVANI